MASAKQIAWRKKFARMSKAGKFRGKKGEKTRIKTVKASPNVKAYHSKKKYPMNMNQQRYEKSRPVKKSTGKLTTTHKALIKKDVKENREIYRANVSSLGGFDPSMLVESTVYTKINRDFGNTRFNHNPTQEKVDDLIADYLITLKLEYPN